MIYTFTFLLEKQSVASMFVLEQQSVTSTILLENRLGVSSTPLLKNYCLLEK